MTLEDALDDEETISLAAARAELKRHGCRIVATFTDAPFGGEPSKITVTNDFDPPEEIDCTPAAILAWLGY